MPCHHHRPERVVATAPTWCAGERYDRCTVCGRVREAAPTRFGRPREWRDAREAEEAIGLRLASRPAQCVVCGERGEPDHAGPACAACTSDIRGEG